MKKNLLLFVLLLASASVVCAEEAPGSENLPLTYGTGEAQKYFYREFEQDNNFVVKETSESSKAEFIVNYSTENSSSRIQNGTGDIISNFIENELSGVAPGKYGAAIYNKNNDLGTINGSFIENGVNVRQKGYGGAISNENGVIEKIQGDFAGNYVTTTSNYSLGGGIYNSAGGNIQKIDANFIGNHTSSKTSSFGGAIYNGSLNGGTASSIGDIKGDFVGNYTTNKKSDAFGGAVFNNNKSTINSIEGDFISNYAYKTETGTGMVRGGAIYNKSGEIGSIKSDFVENYGKSVSGNVLGGAIYNDAGKIGVIEGDFTKNSAQGIGYSSTNGGAIANYGGEIAGIYGDFTDNSVNVDLTGGGGAIYNFSNSVINNIQGTFSGNSVVTSSENSRSSYGGAIYNGGTMTITDSQFLNNSVHSDYAYGGAIYNSNTTLNIVADKKDVVFTGNNINGVSNALYNNAGYKDATVNLNSGDSKIIFNDAITGKNAQGTAAIININKQDVRPTAGIVEFNNLVTNNSVNLYDGTLKLGSYTDESGTTSFGNFDDTVNLTLNGGTLSMVDGRVNQDYNVGSLVVNGGKIAIDVDLLDDGKADKVTVGNFELNQKIGFSDINVIDAVKAETGSVKVLDNVTGEIFEDFSAFSSEGTVHFTDGLDGTLNYTTTKGGALNAAVDYANGDRAYNLSGIETVSENLGAMVGAGSSLNINGNNNTIDGSGFSGIETAEGQTLTFNDAVVENFSSETSGAVVNNSGVLNLNNTIFVKNTSAQEGAAISNTAAGVVNMGGAVKFSENTVNGDSNAIYNEGTINLFDAEVTLSDAVKGLNGTINIDKSTVEVANVISGNTLNLNNGTVKLFGSLDSTSNFVYNSGLVTLQNNAINSANMGNLTLNNNMNLALDANLADATMDTISANSFVANDYKINVSNINILKPTHEKSISLSPISNDTDDATREALSDAIVYIGGDIAYSPIYKYDVDYKDGLFRFSLPGSGGAPAIAPETVYNPGILSTSVALQAQAHAGLREAMNYSFEHLDTFSKLPQRVRFSKINANKYAISEFNKQMPLQGYIDNNDSGYWLRPYSVFESIDLSHGPKVDNISYGTLIGFDSKFKQLKRDWVSVYSLYVGYNGSNLSYDNVDINSNGGSLGFTQTLYKNNFWTALTASAGASVGTVHQMYGSDNFTSLNAGISSRTGHNFEFKNGRFIIQPMMSLSYYFANIFDYKNCSGVRMESDPLHAFELKPGIRFIGNTKKGWQPYVSVAMVWNIFDKSNVTADGIKLPQMSMQPYVEYGLGIQRTWDENFTGYLQSMARSGGRNGVALTFGARWLIGRKKVKERI